MEVEVKFDGKSVLKARVRLATLIEAIADAVAAEGSESISTPLTPAQAQDLLERVDSKSTEFLRRIALNGGSIDWVEMQAIFGIDDDWNEYTTRYGKGITRALRNITGGAQDKLIHWDDDTWEEESVVRIDGMALNSLRKVIGVA